MNRIIKRIFDLIVSTFLLLILFPLFIFISILIKIDSSGPVFFFQERPGMSGVPFNIYKYRTMVTNSEIMIRNKEVHLDDPRITKIGKFLRRSKIDELPQILNVFTGSMSLVGPRPERMSSLEFYDENVAQRLLVRPGMTGLAQVSGNIFLDLEHRYAFDVYYIENYSLYLDIKIILRTIGVIIRGEEYYLNKPLVNIEKM